jgi:cold-inducible RNA-binding protein
MSSSELVPLAADCHCPFRNSTRNETHANMKLYVGNLPYRLSEDELQNTFAAHGQVTSVNIVMDRETGRSKGFAFVEMSSDAEAEEALRQLNGKDLGGRPLRVDRAKPQAQRPRSFRRG